MSDAQPLSIFLPSLRGGGAERMMLNLARGFAERGLLVDLVLAKAEGPYLSQVPAGVRVVDLGAGRVLGSLPGLVRYLRQKRPTALLSALDHANVVALWARSLSRVPTRVVVSVHSTLSCASQNASQAKSRFMPCLVRCFYPWADGVVAISEGVAADLARAAGLSLERIRVIYNPVVTPELPVKAEASLEHPWFAPGAPPVILGVGRLTLAKDFLTLLRAFGRLRVERPARLLILGEGEERRELEALTHKLGLEADVSMPGFVENPFPYMRRSAMLVLSSVWEGFGNVLVEAMACGTPVISTDCPSGPAEILEDGRYGPLVPVGDVEALAEAMLATLKAPPGGEALRLRARDFSLDESTAQYLEALHVVP